MLTFIVSPLGNLLFAISCYCTDVQAIIQALKKICSTHMRIAEKRAVLTVSTAGNPSKFCLSA